jgi:CRISPR-associated protein Csd2
MAPLAYRIAEHGVYCMPFFVNAAVAHKTQCTNKDITVLLKAIPRAYRGTPSMIRNMVEIRHAWYMVHTSALGSCSDFALLDALTPKRRKDQNAEKPSTTWDDYDVPTELPKELREKLSDFKDLVNE